MKKLSLNKETILQLDKREFRQLKAGADRWGKCDATNGCDIENSGGCTDGCGILKTLFNCTNGHCTQDCQDATVTTEKEVTSGNM